MASCVSSLKEDDSTPYVQPHYKESYRLAVFALLCGGRDAYEDFLRAEQLSHLLSDQEVDFILRNARLPAPEDGGDGGGGGGGGDLPPSTYFPAASDEEVPDLDLGWPEVTTLEDDTSISLLFQPPRINTPTIKEVVRKQVQEARQVIAIAMDIFTDVDIFKEIISATLRGVVVYILLDDANFNSFQAMLHRVGINIRELKNLRVRTVQGQQYQCQSSAKFHGGLEQKFILVDCRTVLFGTYSFTWSFEKINLSMVLVVTGQLVGSYDEEFRRLYARSVAPPAVSREVPSLRCLRGAAALHSPTSSQLSLNQIHNKSRLLHGARGAQDDRLNAVAMMTKGFSMQERLHQAHCADMGNLVRGHSYGGELQKMTRLRMGTRDIGPPATPERIGSPLRGAGDAMFQSRASQQILKHRIRYGQDQNLIPFNSETSLHRWKIDAYLNDGENLLDAPSFEAISPLTSPYSSRTGLNEQQNQVIHSRSRDIKTRLEELRQNRLSLQDYGGHRRNQDALRNMYPTLDRTKKSSLRNPDKRQSTPELELSIREAQESTDVRDGCPSGEVDGARGGSDPKTPQAYDRREPPSKTSSSADPCGKPADPPPKLGAHHPRALESLTKIPEEKEGRVNTSDAASLREKKDEKSNAPSEHADKTKPNHGSIGKVPRSSASVTSKKHQAGDTETVPKAPKVSVPSEGTAHSAETPREEAGLQRKNSLRQKVHQTVASDEKKASKKEEKSLQRKGSLRLPSSLGFGPTRPSAQASSVGRPDSRTQSLSRSQNSIGGSSETEKHKSPFALGRLTPQRLSKRKSNPEAEPDRGSGVAPDDEAAVSYHSRCERAYSRYEYLLNTKERYVERTAGATPTDKDQNSSQSRPDAGNTSATAQSGVDKKLGRFMQRVGNFIGKNK